MGISVKSVPFILFAPSELPSINQMLSERIIRVCRQLLARPPILHNLVRCASSTTTVPPLALAYDLETTGLHEAQIIQFAARIVCGGREEAAAEFEGICMPTVEIDPRATEVHGFTRELLQERNAVPFAALFRTLGQWVSSQRQDEEQPLIWAAHNGNGFDHAIFRREAEDALGGGGTWPSAWHYADTLPLARSVLPRGGRVKDHKLGTLYELCAGEPLVDAHDALGDARAVARIWPWLATKGTGDAELFREHLADAVRPPRRSVWDDASDAAADLHAAAAGASSSPAARSASLRRTSSARTTTSTVRASDPLTAIPGVAKRSAGQLQRGKGLTTVGDLVEVWSERCGADKRQMRAWLPGNLHPMVAAKIGVWCEEHAADVVA